MECLQCHHSNPPGSSRCIKCNASLQAKGEGSGVSSGSWSSQTPADGATSAFVSTAAIRAGAVLGGRYEILQLLGEGGMGAVYKAKDRVVDRVVALKVIRSELAHRPEILQRFKQELVLARKVTHKNVIRIFDLGEAEGLKFISMDFVEGRDLKSMAREKGKLAPQEASNIILQVARALQAAHSESVIHRDLKPQNIMVDGQGHVTVMDFGIARSMETPGLTQTGMVVGTPEYMSPEQGRGESVDGRSDLYSLGVISYELLTGKTPHQADTPLAIMLKREREIPRPPTKIDPAIPVALNRVVMKCLEINPQNRYQNALEILQDLESRTGTRTGTPGRLRTLRMPRFRTVERLVPWGIVPVTVAAVVLVLAVAAFLFRDKLFSRAQRPAAPPVSLAILPFRNATGDASLDWMGSSVAEMLSTDVGQSSHLRTVSPDRLHQILRDLRISPNTDYDPDTLSRLADFANADRMVWGEYSKSGGRIQLNASLKDIKREQIIAFNAEAADEKNLMQAVDQLAHTIQENLKLSTNQVMELRAAAFRPTSKSGDALRDFSIGIELGRQGRQLDAVKKFESATQADPEFGLAYSRLAVTYSKLGYDQQAERASQRAVDLSSQLPDPERYRILAADAQIRNNQQKAIEAYENLAKVSPDDAEVQSHLASLYYGMGNYPRASELFSGLITKYPKYVDPLLGMGRVEVLSGNPQAGLDHLNRALSLAVQLDNDEEKGAILHAIAGAYKLLNKSEDALRNYQQALEIRRKLADKGGVAMTLDAMAQVQDLLRQSDQALKSYQEALAIRRGIDDKRGIGDTLINLGFFYESRGQYDKALEYTQESLQIQHEIGEPTYEALCLNNIGWLYLDKGAYDNAMAYFQQGLQLREKLNVPADVADSLYNLADTSSRMGQYDPALAYYLRALELWRKAGDRRGVAIASYGMGMLFQLQGRLGAAVKSEQDALKNIQTLQERGIWLAQIQAGYASAMTLIGRGEEAEKSLEEALAIARELKNDPLNAQILNLQGDSSFYRGDYKTAGPLYEQGLRVAMRAKDERDMIISKIGLAKVAVRQGRWSVAVGSLPELARRSDALRMKYHSVECSVYLGEALGGAKNTSRARQELEAALQKSRDWGLRTLQAQADFQLAGVLHKSGNDADAGRHYAEARRIMDDIRKEAGSDKLQKRSDLAPIFSASPPVS